MTDYEDTPPPRVRAQAEPKQLDEVLSAVRGCELAVARTRVALIAIACVVVAAVAAGTWYAALRADELVRLILAR